MLSNAKIQTLICSTEIETAAKFYRDILGLKLRTRSEGALVFRLGGSDLRVAPVPSLSPSEHTVVGFAVDDIDAAIDGLCKRGVTFERFEGFDHAPNGTVVTPDGARVAWLRDPDGNILSLAQFPSAEY